MQEAYKHCKTIAANGAGAELIHACRLTNGAADEQRTRKRALKKALSSVATIKPAR